MRTDWWTDERIDLLKKLWAEGETAAAIARRLGGLSRSAVLGKIFRLRLGAVEAAATGAKENGAARGESTKAAAEARRESPTPEISPARRRRGNAAPNRRSPAFRPPHKTLLELTNDSCRWPHGRPGTERFFFCGAPGADLEHGIPYCARHMRRAYLSAENIVKAARPAPRPARAGLSPALESLFGLAQPERRA